jgi:conjugative transfer signal peptidase TraF
MSRFGYVMTTYAGMLVLGILSIVHFTPRLIWNASASAPIGLYIITPAKHLAVAELLAIDAPEPLAGFLADRRYLPLGVPLMKHVAALPGQRVCRTDRTITIDGVVMGDALARDSRGRALPIWQGCSVIAAHQVFVMNAGVWDSLDGRYFGPLPTGSIVGRAIPLWTDERGAGRDQGRAPAH